ncbi:hypothetical protein NERG_02732, partial [Nematocida ausubeli]
VFLGCYTLLSPALSAPSPACSAYSACSPPTPHSFSSFVSARSWPSLLSRPLSYTPLLFSLFSLFPPSHTPPFRLFFSRLFFSRLFFFLFLSPAHARVFFVCSSSLLFLPLPLLSLLLFFLNLLFCLSSSLSPLLSPPLLPLLPFLSVLFSPALSLARAYSRVPSLCALSPVLFTAPLVPLSRSLSFLSPSFFLKLFTFLFLFCFLDTFFLCGPFIFPLFPRLCLLVLHTLSFAGPVSLCPLSSSSASLLFLAHSLALSARPLRSVSFVSFLVTPVFGGKVWPVTNYNRD